MPDRLAESPSNGHFVDSNVRKVEAALASADLPTLRLVELDPNDVLPAPGNREVTAESVTDLVESVRKVGQLYPGVVYPDPELAGKYRAGDGNRRLLACRILGKKFKALVSDQPLSKAEVRRIRVTSEIRKSLTSDEIADDIEAHIAETGCTQAAAAAFFGKSAGGVSKLLLPNKKLDPSLVEETKGYCRDVRRIIASLPTPEKQRELAAKLKAIVDEGGTIKRDLVEVWAVQIRGGEKPKKVKSVRAEYDGGKVDLPSDWAGERVVEWFARGLEMAKKLVKVPGATAAFLPGLLKPM